MDFNPAVLAQLPRDLEITFTVKAGDLADAFAKSGAVPEMATTVEISRAWGFAPRKWREWAAAGLIEGAVQDEGGSWRLPKAAAREQFERALGHGPPLRSRTSHLPRAHGPRKKREART